MKHIFFILTLIFSISFMNAQQYKTLYDFKAKTIDGNDFDFSTLKGKKVMIVNTASKCGYTPQYEDLQKLYDKFKFQNFTIIAFPSNDFANQEPGSNEEIIEFCQKNYGVTFQVMDKISVKGNDIHPIYKWLTQKDENGVLDAPVKWNFQKFLIDENGNVVKSFKSSVNPMDEEIVNWIKN